MLNLTLIAIILLLNLTIIILIFLMLTYIVTTEQNIRRYRKIVEELP